MIWNDNDLHGSSFVDRGGVPEHIHGADRRRCRNCRGRRDGRRLVTIPGGRRGATQTAPAALPQVNAGADVHEQQRAIVAALQCALENTRLLGLSDRLFIDADEPSELSERRHRPASTRTRTRTCGP
jgi:hypothetical protein